MDTKEQENIQETMKMSKDTAEYIVLAAGGNPEPLAAATIIQEMGLSVIPVSHMDELERTLAGKDEIIGAIISRRFLGENPLACLGKIRRSAPHIPLIVAASKSGETFERNIRKIGVFYFLLEPYDRGEFLDVVSALRSFKSRKKRS